MLHTISFSEYLQLFVDEARTQFGETDRRTSLSMSRDTSASRARKSPPRWRAFFAEVRMRSPLDAGSSSRALGSSFLPHSRTYTCHILKRKPYKEVGGADRRKRRRSLGYEKKKIKIKKTINQMKKVSRPETRQETALLRWQLDERWATAWVGR